jgi:hypothetical protein
MQKPTINQFSYRDLDGDLVEAIRFTGDGGDLTQAWPKWFIVALAEGQIEYNNATKQFRLDRFRNLHLTVGDWIVQEYRWGKPVLNVYTESNFEVNFMKAE